jgi:hypothetical protein
MKKLLIALALFCVPVLACGRGSAPGGDASAMPEPPPPLIEPALGPGSQLIDPRADELVRKMSAWLAETKALTIDAEEIYDEVPAHGPRRQLAGTRHVSMRRPDRLAGDASGDAVNRAFFYDGRTLSLYDKEQNVWASGAVPPTIDGALDFIFDQTGTIVPLADFLYADPYARLMGGVQRGAYLGIHDAAGVPCHHLAFEQANIDWQLWIDAGAQPMPRKLVITYKTEDEVPQYSATITKLTVEPTLPDALFRFTPPAGATPVEVVAETATGDAPGSAGTSAPATQAQEKKQ